MTIITGNKFLDIGKKLQKTEVLIFLSFEKYEMLNPFFVIR